MVDIFALALSHGLLALAVLRLLLRSDLDEEGEAPVKRKGVRDPVRAARSVRPHGEAGDPPSRRMVRARSGRTFAKARTMQLPGGASRADGDDAGGPGDA